MVEKKIEYVTLINIARHLCDNTMIQEGPASASFELCPRRRIQLRSNPLFYYSKSV